MATEEGIPSVAPQADPDVFSFDEWVVSSGLSALKDILIKHNMQSPNKLSTESAEFAAFISDPLLLPRAMLIPQAIQSMQKLQDSLKQQMTQLQPQQQNVAHMHSNEEDSSLNEEAPDKSDSSEHDSCSEHDNGLFTRYKQYKKDKEAHRNSSKGSLSEVSSIISDNPKVGRSPSIIKEAEAVHKKKRKMVRLKVGDHIKFVTAKRYGVVRWMGQTEFMPALCYGIEVYEGRGDCDGSPYFQTAPNMAVFAMRKILRRIKPKKHIANIEEDRSRWRRSVKKKNKKRKKARPATLGAVDFSTMYRERASTKKKDDDYYKKARKELKKEGPREIGKIKYDGLKIKKKKKKKHLDGIIPKLGPRDIGKIKYDGLKLSKTEQKQLESGGFLEDKTSHSVRKKAKVKSDRALFNTKLGPQDIGRIKYKGTKLTKKQKDELARKQLLEDKTHHVVKKKKKLHRRARSLIGTKLGPVDMGKNKHYKGTKYRNTDDDDDDGNILKEKTHVVIKKKWRLNNKQSDYDDDDDEYDSEGVIFSDDADDIDIDSDDPALSLRPKRKNSKIKINTKVKTKKLKRKAKTKRKKNKLKKINSSPIPLNQDESEDAVALFYNNGYYEEGETNCDKTQKLKSKKKKRRKEKQKKRKKNNMNKYRRKLKNNKAKSSQHVYGHDSDQEYIEHIKNNVYYTEDDKEEDVQEKAPPKLVQSQSIPSKEEKVSAEAEIVAAEAVEIEHRFHANSETDSDSDVASNGSLNALSSSESDNINDDVENQESKWI